jgi:peptide/nickel transport system substrate-binding protein
MYKKIFYPLMLVVILAAILMGCSTQSTTTTPPKITSAAPSTPTTSSVPSAPSSTSKPGATTPVSQATPNPSTQAPKYGGDLKLISTNIPANVGVPYLVAGSPDMIYGYECVETLFRLDKQLNLIPWLATGYKTSDDMKSITITLRQGVKFHDDTNFNADAVKYNLDKYRAGAQPELKKISSVDVVDNYTVRLNIDSFQTNLLPSLTLRPGLMVSPAALKQYGDDASKLHPVGTGPFKFDSYKQAASLKFTKYDGYWQKGKPYLDSVEWVLVADVNVAVMAFQSGQGMAITTNAESTNDLKKTGKYTIASTPAWISGMIADSANADSPFSKLQVRQAVSYAIDKVQIANLLGFGFWEPAEQNVPSQSPYFSKNITGYPYNPSKAKSLLADAGYGKGFETQVTYMATWNCAAIFPVIQSNFNAIGIKLNLNPVTQAVMVQQQSQGWKGLIQYNFAAQIGTDLGSSLLNQLSSKASQYISAVHPSDMDAKIMQVASEPDLAKQKILYQDILKMATDTYAVSTPVLANGLSYVRYPSVHELNIYEYWYYQWTPEETWIDK